MVTSRGSRYGRVDNSIMLGISTCYNILLYYTRMFAGAFDAITVVVFGSLAFFKGLDSRIHGSGC